jgi:anthranilate synthase component 1
MLVDLARNDLSRNGHDVQVEKYRRSTIFRIHLVSKVTAIYMKKLQPCKLLLIPFQQEL